MEILEPAILFRLKTRTVVSGELTMPCVPAMLDEYIKIIEKLLGALCQNNMTTQEIQSLRPTIATKLEAGFKISPNTLFIFKYETQKVSLGIAGRLQITTIIKPILLENKYQNWLNKSPPIFGIYTDAKFMVTALQFRNTSSTPILDVGAGNGRHSIPLSKKGYPVDAIELNPAFAEKLSRLDATENLPINVIQGNILDQLIKLRFSYYQLAIVSEVISHFQNIDQVRLLLAKMCDVIRSGGLLLFNCFLTENGYEPDDKARQIAQILWSFLMTRSELKLAMAGLPLKIISEESLFEYERNHLPP